MKGIFDGFAFRHFSCKLKIMTQKNKQTSKSKYTILIVDDEPSNIAILAQFLSETYEVKVARSAEQAFEILDTGLMPDFIFLDVVMPGGMSGVEACRKLKNDTKTQYIPIIFLTGRDAVNDEIEGLEAGAIDYISKPFNLQLVHHRLRIHLQQALIKKNLRLNEKVIQKHQKDLLAADERSRLLLETVRNGIVSVDLQGHINFVNLTASKLLAWPKEELLGKDIYSTFYQRLESHGIDYAFFVECPLLAPLHTGLTSCRDDQVFNRRDGSTLSVEFHSAPIFQGKKIIGVVFNFDIISNRLRSVSKMLLGQMVFEKRH